MQIFSSFVIFAMVLFRIIGGELEPEIEMPATTTILELKERIDEILKVEVARQTLWFGFTSLENDHSIESYSFSHFTTLGLIVRPLPRQLKFNILVKSSSRVEHIRVRETQKVAELRNKISKHWSIPVVNVAFIRLTKKMDDDLPLCTYYIVQDFEVEVKVRIEPH